MLHAIVNGHPETVTARLPLMLLPAFLACYLSAKFDVPGLLSFSQLAAFAISAAAFRGYRTERGLWMLAGLFFVLWCGIFGLAIYGESRDVLRGVAPPMNLIVDAAFAMFLMRAHVTFLWNTARLNFEYFRA